MKIAVLGAGDMGARHVRAWSQLGHEVVSVTDVDTERARELAKLHRIGRTYSDFREAVADPEPDIVSICLPLTLHAPATIAAAGHEKHVISEKPLCRTFREADHMEAAVQSAGVRFGVGFQRNLAEGVVLLRRWAAEGRFGRPMVFTSDLLQEVRPKRIMHDRDGNNGPLTDAGCHYYMLWQTVFRSKPRLAYAQGRILATERPELAHINQLAIDTAVVTVEYESGDLGTLTVSWGLPAGFQLKSRADRIVGPTGGAEGGVNGRLNLYEGDRIQQIELTSRDLHEVELALFAEAVRGGPLFPSGFKEGRQMLALTHAILRSIETGQPEPVSYDC
ncbi:MAG: Gfo/Idh/MocA family oxidoreductase [Chloroflexota bacterium]|nr:Gfo/Idh/MocA family oxidoreductase [Chloroflexota bacterium]